MSALVCLTYDDALPVHCEVDKAMHALSEALTLAEPEGFIRLLKLLWCTKRRADAGRHLAGIAQTIL